MSGAGTKADPWQLKTPPLTSEYELHEMLRARADWVELGSADEQKPAKEGTVEAWGRSPDNPVGGWYGVKKGLRGRFGMYLPPLLEALGKAELEHNARNNRMHGL
jgi:hypothetical protein